MSDQTPGPVRRQLSRDRTNAHEPEGHDNGRHCDRRRPAGRRRGLDRLAGVRHRYRVHGLARTRDPPGSVLLNNAGCALLGRTSTAPSVSDTLTAFFGDADEATVIRTGRRTSRTSRGDDQRRADQPPQAVEGVSKGSVPGNRDRARGPGRGRADQRSGRGSGPRGLVVGYESSSGSPGRSPATGPAADTIQASRCHRGGTRPRCSAGSVRGRRGRRLHGLSRQEMVEAFGIVGNLAPTTTFASFRGGADVKPLGSSGWSSALGILSARLAKEGLTGGGGVAADLFPLWSPPIDYGCLTAGLRRRPGRS
ncbi:MmgE/PrpD family protein [Pseudonocardia sp. MCCB 268]|nr:MmgE/PrpD family protein [Pseudonocardia cytotoxica]